MKIKVVPRIFFLSMQGTDKEKEIFDTCNIISINTEGIEEVPFSKEFQGRKNVLILYFDDIIQTDPQNCGRIFSADNAKAISVFLKRADLNIPLVVHCTAGISRSGAVGQVLNDFFNNFYEKNPNDYEAFTKTHGHLIPNFRVRSVLMSELSCDWLKND